jgi:hypothetical protein
MLFEARAPSPKKITPHVSPRPLTTTRTPLKTYRQRPRSDAAPPKANTSLCPSTDSSPPPVSRDLEVKRGDLPAPDESGTSSELDHPKPIAELVPGSAFVPPRPPRRTRQDQVATPSKRGRI